MRAGNAGSIILRWLRRYRGGVKGWQLVALAGLAVLSLVLFEPVYVWGRGNQASQIPLIRHAMDPNHLARDWTVQQRTDWSSPRFAYVQAMAGLASLLGVAEALALTYVLATVASLSFLYLIVREWFGDRLVALVVVGFFLSPFTAVVNLGGNTLVNASTIPTTVANPLILGAMYGLLKGHRIPSYLALGCASAIHLSNGIVMTGVLTIADVVRSLDLRETTKLTDVMREMPWGGFGVWLLVALPFLAPIAWENLTYAGSSMAVTITAWIRHPHHHIPSAWPLVPLVTTSLLIAVATTLIFLRADLVRKRYRDLVRAYVGVLVVGSVVAAFAVEVYRIETIIKLQTFHVDSFLFIPLVGVLSKVGFDSMAKTASRFSGLSTAGTPAVVLALVLLSGIGIQAYSKGLPVPGAEGPEIDEDLRATYAWISEETPEDAMFLAPPDDELFRSEAKRAQVANWKSFPFRPAAMLEWKDRLDRLCNADVGDLRVHGDPLSSCADGYAQLPEGQAEAVAERYDACWILTTQDGYNYEEAYRSGGYIVYHRC